MPSLRECVLQYGVWIVVHSMSHNFHYIIRHHRAPWTGGAFRRVPGVVSVPGALAICAGLVLPAHARVTVPAPRGEASAIHTIDRALESPGQARHVVLANGLRVRLYTAETLAMRLTSLGGEPIIPLDSGRYFRVITRVDDPGIYNKGDGHFHPFSESKVLDDLAALKYPALDFDVTVYLLPYPRRELLVSSTSGNEMFLSPHVLDIASSVSAYIVSHEMGHVVHNQYMPPGSSGWNRYRKVRGITDTSRFNDDAPHAFRPREIFAEDFRVLFGSEEAAFGGHIENSEISMPRDVPGLENFFIALGTPSNRFEPRLTASSFPNPFNPDTRIHVELPNELVSDGAPVTVQIYDVRGALVRELYDGAAASGIVDVGWDGTDQNGRRVASATYFVLVRSGRARATVKLVMIK